MKTISICAVMCLTVGLVRADWLQFRGPNATAVSTEAKVPAEELKIAWTAELPGRGLSAPIVVGDKVFVTCSSGPGQETLHVFCFNAKDGSKKWERAMRATGRTMSHNKTCVAANTPCSDGDRVFALFSSNDLFAFDLDGNLLWLRGLTLDYPNASNSLGMAQSPVVLNGTLVVQSENDSESFAAGLDVATGRNLWKLDRPKAANWSSATLWKGAVALQSSKGILAVESATGKTVWNYTDGASTTPSSVVTGEVLYAVSHGITALAPEKGAVTQLWRNEKLNPGTASPLVLGEHLYVVNGAGVLIKASLKNGDELWKLRLKGPFSGSPVAAGKRIFIVNERGIFQTIDPEAPEGKVTQEIELKETVLTTPAISDGAIYVRSDTKLWKLQ
ncbi:MAG: PQQ-binding-like beta-propeller repeat protein [Prosthecobacter sp.]|uniref:outer membrane protein assembly factor BamB family protein n=1 Tax=Prosthecobacter sp. TaxID=1965333 RepID=UPI00390023CA